MGIRYSPSIDMWSLGCILYELYAGTPLFTGEDEVEQMQCIMEVKGVPPRSMIVCASRKKLFFNEEYQPIMRENSKGTLRIISSRTLHKLMLEEQGPPSRHTSRKSLKEQSDQQTREEFIDFVDRCLEWKPEKRISPQEAFQHPWIKAGITELKNKVNALQ